MYVKKNESCEGVLFVILNFGEKLDGRIFMNGL